MKNKILVCILSAVMIAAAVSSCSAGTAETAGTKSSAALTSAADETAGSAVQTVSDDTASPSSSPASASSSSAPADASASGSSKTSAAAGTPVEQLPSEIAKPLTGMIMVYGQGDFGPDTEITNDQAISYLSQMASLFYSDRAQTYEEIGTKYKYAAFDETEVDQFLDEAFGGRYSTKELLTENTPAIYNAHKYYIPLQDEKAVPVISGVEAGAGANQYTYKILYQGVEQTLNVTSKESTNNPIGYSILSYSFF